MFAERFRELVKASGKSFTQIGAESGLNKASIGTWYRGEKMPNSKALITLCKYFDVSADWLLGLSNFRRLKK